MSNAKSVLTFALVALLGALVWMAPGAHAKNQLVVEGKVLAEGEVVEIKATGGNYWSAIPELGILLECPTATLSLTMKNQASRAVGSGTAVAQECTIIEFEEVCESHSTGQPPGSIQIFSESLEVRSLSTNRYLLSTVQTPAIEHGGEECPFTELALSVQGMGGFKFANPFSEAVSHTVTDITPKEESELEASTFLGGSPLYVEAGEATGHLTGKFEGMNYSFN